MRLTSDYHTHTQYSKNNHGKDSVQEMVKIAEEKGIENYGISDHGPKHFLFGIKSKNISKEKAELNALKSQTNLNLFFGIEANLCGKNGEIDLSNEQIKQFDHILVGFHRGVLNNFYSPLRALINPEKQIEISTNAYLNCLDKYKVFAITHPNTYIKVDIAKIAKKAKEKGTYIELNNKHLNFDEKEAKILKDSGCLFLVSSDAHKKENIARVDNVFEFIKKYDIPLDRIVNVEEN